MLTAWAYKGRGKIFKTSWANTTSCRLWWSHVIKLGFTPELSNKAVKLYRTPHVDEGSLVASDEADRGQVSNVAAKLVMKFMWLGEEFQVWNLRPSQSKMVFRKIDNSKALSSWMANLFSKNPGTEVPKTRIHGMNGIYMLGGGGGNSNIFRIFTPKIGEMIPNSTSISFNWFGSTTN